MKKSLTSHVEMVERRRLINSEYQRGFMEGQQKAAKEFAGLIDNMLGRYDHVALAGRYVATEKIKHAAGCINTKRENNISTTTEQAMD